MSDFERNEIKRENITAYILFCIIFAVGSFVFYKKTGNVYWAIALFVCSVILLGFYSRILALEDEMVALSEEADEYEEEEQEEKEDDEDHLHAEGFDPQSSSQRAGKPAPNAAEKGFFRLFR